MSMSQESNRTGGRNFALDIAKGLCIVLMVIGHSGAPEWLHDLIYVFHMPCFFIISGILFREKYLDKVSLLIHRRLKSLWWPFALWTMIFVLLHNFYYSIHLYDDSYSTSDILHNIKEAIFFRKTEQLLGGFWFLRALFFATVFSVFWLKFMGSEKRKIILGIFLFLTISVSCKYFEIHNAYINYRAFLGGAYFLTGRLMSDIRLYTPKYGRVTIGISIVVIITASIYMPVNMLTVDWQQVVPYYFVSTAVCFGVIVICTKMPTHLFLAQKMIYIGSRTIDILIFHF